MHKCLTECFAIVLSGLVLLAPITACGSDASDRLARLDSWSALQATAKERKQPIVLLVEQRHCAYCQRLKRDLIGPLANDAAFGHRAVFVSLLTDSDEPLVEKDGVKISGFEFAEQFQANTTPTVLFLDHASNELQRRMVGYEPGEQYESALKEKIELSIGAAGKPKD